MNDCCAFHDSVLYRVHFRVKDNIFIEKFENISIRVIKFTLFLSPKWELSRTSQTYLTPANTTHNRNFMRLLLKSE